MFTEIQWFESTTTPMGRLDKRLSQNSMKVSKQIQQILLNCSLSFKTEMGEDQLFSIKLNPTRLKPNI